MDYEPSYKEFATIFKALSDETRLRVIDMLSCKEMSACDILSNFTLSQSTLSYHMKILIEAGVVDARREGLWTKYSINDDTFNRIMDFMPELYKLKDKCICRQIKYCKTPEECGEGKDPFGNGKGLRACKGSFFVCIDKNDHCVRTPRRSEFPFLPK